MEVGGEKEAGGGVKNNIEKHSSVRSSTLPEPLSGLKERERERSTCLLTASGDTHITLCK